MATQTRQRRIANPANAQELLEMLHELDLQAGPGDLVRTLSAFLRDKEIADVVDMQPATIRTWRRPPETTISPDAHDKLDLVRVIAIRKLEPAPSAWTPTGLGAWFRTRLLGPDGDIPRTPLQWIADGDGEKLLKRLQGH